MYFQSPDNQLHFAHNRDYTMPEIDLHVFYNGEMSLNSDTRAQLIDIK